MRIGRISLGCRILAACVLSVLAPTPAFLQIALSLEPEASSLMSAESPVTALAFAPDGRSVVVGSQSGVTVRSWPRLELVAGIDTSMENVHELAFSPDGRRLAIAGGKPAREGGAEIVSWPGGESECLLTGHEDSATSAVWTDRQTLATAGLDHVVLTWDVPSRKTLRKLTSHSRGVTGLCYVASKRLLVSGGIDQNICVWGEESARPDRTLNNHTRKVNRLATRPIASDAPLIASISDDRTVRFWQPTIGRMVRFTQLDSIPLDVAWLADGSRVAVASEDGRVRVIDPATAEVLRDLPAIDGWAYSLAAHPADGSLLVGGENGRLVRIELAESDD